MWLRTNCDICFEIVIPTPFTLMLRPRSGANQWIAREVYTLNPIVPALEYTDNYGNLCQRLIAPPGVFSIHTEADIHTSEQIDIAPGAPFDGVQMLPDSVLTYLLPSRYCEADRFIELAQEIVAGLMPGYDQVDAVNRWLRENIRFNPDAAEFQLSAVEVNQVGQGVCRDLAHLGIALCRALCIPTRMVVGYLHGLSPMDFHAWFEAYVGGRWYTFDPTQQEPRGGRVIVAYGHDAADVAIFTQFGPPLYPTHMSVSVERLPDSQE
ncbi:MAG: cysteine protease [Methylomonas sp.]|jgi:transglutaminase-like putative cysteine protease|nr:MAG: cysteine protease [Methylomonas sp.]